MGTQAEGRLEVLRTRPCTLRCAGTGHASPSKAPLGDRLCAIIKKELGMDAFPKDPFAWISYKDGNKLVEVLKGYVKTAQKSRGDADG